EGGDADVDGAGGLRRRHGAEGRVIDDDEVGRDRPEEDGLRGRQVGAGDGDERAAAGAAGGGGQGGDGGRRLRRVGEGRRGRRAGVGAHVYLHGAGRLRRRKGGDLRVGIEGEVGGN